MQNNEEIWKDVFGYEGLYEISNIPRVRRGNISSRICKTGTIITQRIDRHGYLIVCLWKNNKEKRARVHVLYMRAFVGERTGIDIRHLDDNKLNNTPKNLCYGTRGENTKDSFKNNPNRKGFNCPEILSKAVKNRIESNRKKAYENNRT